MQNFGFYYTKCVSVIFLHRVYGYVGRGPIAYNFI